ncbi:GTP cyclohydrolase II [Oceaniglobus trochenteri]|uniref:GTP cyclohydrolase II n=1 Tax=Oceaniglobus trochenteri TaxID=2763260 RepID=UPI001CFF6E60|nr:GTP cyclohydrolase II [Oceaniglobus trochenteri]
MTLAPLPAERLARARSDLRTGLPIVLCDGDAAVLVAAPEVLAPARYATLLEMGGAVLAITHRRAQTLKTPTYDGDLTRIALPPTMELARLRAIVDPADDLRSPLKGPFQPVRGGSTALARAAIALLKSARLLPGALLVPLKGDAPDLTRIDLADPALDLVGDARVSPVIAARLPMAAARAGRLHIFHPEDGGEEHYAVEIGRPDRDAPVLTRLHSACFTGDVLGSLKCDCGPQLNGALAQMNEAGGGLLLYLNQEGRGIGLTNKMRAYSLQDQGFDTVEANHRLGFEDDERDFRIGARMLSALGVGQVRLLTNNPRKVDMLAQCGLTVVERVPLHVGQNPLNEAYLRTKAAKSGHIL